MKGGLLSQFELRNSALCRARVSVTMRGCKGIFASGRQVKKHEGRNLLSDTEPVGGGRYAEVSCRICLSVVGWGHASSLLFVHQCHPKEPKMKIGLLQLSDIHFREGEQNPVANRAEAIARAVCTEGSEVDGLILLLTGDVAFSGKAGEYVIAEKFVQMVYQELKLNGKAPDALAIVPGNHDCDFDRDDEVRRQLIQSPAAFTDESVVRACTGVQQSYDQFAEAVEGLSIENGKLLVKQTVEIRGQSVNLFLFNSAWMSKEREQGGSICVPRDFGPALVEGADGALNVWLMHHPYAWFEPESQKRLRGVVEERADIVLTGHEHDTASYVRQSSDARVNYVEGGVLQESPKSSASLGFRTSQRP